ncbi:hypothetical protein Tco_1247428 [Tanacetum coccineum]
MTNAIRDEEGKCHPNPDLVEMTNQRRCKDILKQQFEGFSYQTQKGFIRSMKGSKVLLSQLEIHRAGPNQEEYISSYWRICIIIQVFENDVKGSTASSSSTQNVAFVSENTSSTNDIGPITQKKKKIIAFEGYATAQVRDTELDVVVRKKAKLLLRPSSRHMTGNKAYLAEYQDFNGGPVAFGGSKGYITGKDQREQANKYARSTKANQNAVQKNIINARGFYKEDEYAQDYFVLPIWSSYSSTIKRSRAEDAGEAPHKHPDLKTDEKPVDKEDQVFLDELERLKRQEKDANDAAEALRKEFAQETENFCF